MSLVCLNCSRRLFRKIPQQICLALAVFVVNPSRSQTTPTPKSGNSVPSLDSSQSVLKQHYDAAQHFQEAGDLDQAARQYRIFIADALGEIAIGRARLGEYDRAAAQFDEALALAPNSPVLLIEYAQAALAAGQYSHAELLTGKVLQNYPPTSSAVTKAHLIFGRTLLKMNKDKEARRELEAAVANDPSFENGYALAVACLDVEDGDCASKLFSEMQSSFGDTAQLHLQFGLAYGNSDFQQLAVAEFKKAIAEDPSLPAAHYCLAAAYLSNADASNLDGAAGELHKELEISPNDSLTYAALGRIAYLQSKYPDAERYLKRAIALDPHNPDAYLYLGQAYVALNRPADAEAALIECIHWTTDVSRNRYQVQKAHYMLGRLLAKSGDHAAAQTEMKAAEELLHANFARDNSRLSGMMSSGAADTAVAYVDSPEQTPSKADPEVDRKLDTFEKQLTQPVADSYNNLGAIAAQHGDYATALADFHQAAAWNPQLEGLDYNWGRAAFAASSFDAAVPPLTRYLSTHPQDATVRSALAISLFALGHYDKVLKTLEPVKPDAQSPPQVAWIYAQSLVMTGQRSAGIALLVEIEKANPDFEDVHRSLGEDWGGSPADRPSATKELTTAIRLNPNDAQAHYDLGKLILDSGDAKTAISELEMAVSLSPWDPRAHQELLTAYKQDARIADADRETKRFDGLTASDNTAEPSPPPQ